MKLKDFFERLDGLGDSIPLNGLKELLCELQVACADLGEYLQFSECKYQRNLLRRTQNYEVLLLCFEPGQQTPVHDHAGSACGVKVLKGTATEVGYRCDTSGKLCEMGKCDLAAGGVVGSNDMDIHLLENSQVDEQLVTLHVYSPPLGEVGNYSLEDNSKTLVTAESREMSS